MENEEGVGWTDDVGHFLRRLEIPPSPSLYEKAERKTLAVF